MSENNNNWNNWNPNKKKKINYILYWFIFLLILNIFLLVYISKPKPTLHQEALNLYNQNQATYWQIQELKKILNGWYNKK